MSSLKTLRIGKDIPANLAFLSTIF